MLQASLASQTCAYPGCKRTRNGSFVCCSSVCGRRLRWLSEPVCKKCGLCSPNTRAKGAFVVYFQSAYYDKTSKISDTIVLGFELYSNGAVQPQDDYKNTWNLTGGKADPSVCAGCEAVREGLEESKISAAYRRVIGQLWIGNTFIIIVEIPNNFSLQGANATIQSHNAAHHMPHCQREMGLITRFKLADGQMVAPNSVAVVDPSYVNQSVSGFALGVMRAICKMRGIKCTY